MRPGCAGLPSTSEWMLSDDSHAGRKSTDTSGVVDPQLRLDQEYYVSPGTPPCTSAGTWQPAAPQHGRRYLLLAVLLAVLPGVFFIFGCGHFYAGRWRTGSALLVGYWAVVIPLVTFAPPGSYAFAWLAFLVGTPISAARAVRRRNATILPA